MKTLPLIRTFGFVALLAACIPAAPPSANDAFERYSQFVEDRIHSDRATAHFMRLAGDPAVHARLQRGEIVAVPAKSLGLQPSIAVSGGQVQHWIGTGFVPNLTIAAALPQLRNYRNRKIYMQPDIIDSALLRREGADFSVYLRMLEKAVLSGIYDVNLRIRYWQLDASILEIDSRSQSIVEVASASAAVGSVAPDHGLLWQLNDYWRFSEADHGIYLECEALVLSRDTPHALGWLADPLIARTARKKMEKTVSDTMRLMVAADPPAR